MTYEEKVKAALEETNEEMRKACEALAVFLNKGTGVGGDLSALVTMVAENRKRYWANWDLIKEGE